VNKRSLVLYLTGLAAAGAVVGLAASCSDQPRIKCTAQHGPFSVTYAKTSGDENCGPKGGQIGVEQYNYPLPDGTNLDPNHGKVALQPLDIDNELAKERPADPLEDRKTLTHVPYAMGDYGSPEPGGDNFCDVPTLNKIEQNLGPAPELHDPDSGAVTQPAEPPLVLKYEWSRVRFYNTPASPGTQLVADLSYSKTIQGVDGGAAMPCTANYHVVGLWPSVPCTLTHPDLPAGKDDPNYDCSPDADPENGKALGSGISSDLQFKCDGDIGFCVLTKEPPAFK
jgi:hypothetical protein